MRVDAERAIGAPPELVYELISNYEEHRPRFLPEAFMNFTIEEGGIGEGTIVRFRIKHGGRVVPYRMIVTEPEPGEVLSEADPEAEVVTRFIVKPMSGGAASAVRIETMWRQSAGMTGMIERVLATRLLRGMYTEQLDLLDQYTRTIAEE